jgi:general secretion pathway protein C
VKDGKPEGFKLYAIRPGSLFDRLGMLNGDTMTSINGFALTSADKALEVYTKLRETKEIEVDLVRGGKPVKLQFSIRD